MGILDKIEDKLGGGSKNQDSTTTYEQDGDYSNTTTSPTATNSRQHPVGSGLSGTAVTGGTAVDNNSHSVPGSFPGTSHGPALSSGTGYGNNGAALSSGPGYSNANNTTTSSVIPDRTRNETTTTTSTVTRLGGNKRDSTSGRTTDHSSPRQAYDSRNPYGASNNRGPAGDTGSRRDIDDPEVRRTAGGGVSNQVLQTGPHSDLENRDAVPVAGGQKLGTGAAYDSPSQGTPNHYGRDAAVVGGVGAAGATGYGATNARGDAGYASKDSTTVGPHKSDLLNKLDPRVDSDQSKAYDSQARSANNTTTTGASFGSNDRIYDSRDQYGGRNNTSTAGPHNSDMMNKMDPRVDSDRSKAYPNDNTTTGSGFGSNDRNYDSRDQYGGRNNTSTAGPHNSDMLNKLDPRVDSDRSKAYPNNNTTTGFGSNDRNYDSRDQYGGRNNTSTAGPHDSDTANKLDPRVDSDRSKAYPFDNYGVGNVHHRNHGSRDNFNNYDSRDDYDSRDQYNNRNRSSGFGFNSRDRRDDYDSRDNYNTRSGRNDYDSRDNYNTSDRRGDYDSRDQYDTPSRGKTTAGPHKSDWMNKLDPRVDSDRSKEQDYDDSYNTRDQRNSNNFGRDAALAGGAGALGAGAASRHHHHRNSSDRRNNNDDLAYSQADQPLSQSRDFNDRHGRNHNDRHGFSSRDNNNNDRYDNNDIGRHSSTRNLGSNQTAGFNHAKRLGGAYGAGYEAGYNDALLHAEQDRSQRDGRRRF